MGDFENKLQEQLKNLANAHIGDLEKEVATLQESLQDLVKSSFGKVLKTASQTMEAVAKNDSIAKLASDMSAQLVAEKSQLETSLATLKTENEKLLAEKTELENNTKDLKSKNKKLSNSKTELETTITDLKTENEKVLSDLKIENERLLAEKKTLATNQATKASENKTSTSLAILKAAINEIQTNKTQSDVLSALVSQASSFSPRIALFIVKSGNAIGWMARGFDSEQVNNSIKGVSIPLQADTVLRAVLGKQVVFVGSPSAQAENQILFSRFNNSIPTQILGVPLLVRGKAAAVLYADSSNLEGDVINAEALEILVNMAGLAIELISVRPRPVETATQPAVAPQPLAAQNAPAIEKPSVIPSQNPIAAIQSPLPAAPLTTTASTPVVSTPLPVQIPEVEKPAKAAKPENSISSPVPVLDTKPKPEKIEKVEKVEKVEKTGKIARPEEVRLSSPPPFPRIDSIEPAKKVELPEISAYAAPPDAKAPPIMPMLKPSEKSTEPSFSFKEENLLKGSSAGVKANAPNPFASEPPLPKLSPPDWQAPIDFSKPPTKPLPPITPQSIPVPISHPGQSSAGQKVQQVKPVPANDEEQKLHNDARRFARLLVSEIKLYNEQKVLDGRKHSDLYDRLKEDIDRSRQMYDKRVSALVAAKYDYFYDELVNTLAEGDAVKLGRDCPGPSVQVA